MTAEETDTEQSWSSFIMYQADRFITYWLTPKKYKFGLTLIFLGMPLVAPPDTFFVNLLRNVLGEKVGNLVLGTGGEGAHYYLGIVLVILGIAFIFGNTVSGLIRPIKTLILDYSYTELSKRSVWNIVTDTKKFWKHTLRLDSRKVDHSDSVSINKQIKRIRKLTKKVSKNRDILYSGVAFIPFVMYLGQLLRNFSIRFFEIDHNTRRANEILEDNDESLIGVSINIVDDNYSAVEVVLSLSLSFRIQESQVRDSFKDMPIVELVADEVFQSNIKDQMQMSCLTKGFRDALNDICSNHTNLEKVHFLFAGQTSVAFKLGQQIAPNTDKEIISYHWNRDLGYCWGVSINNGGNIVQL